MKRSFVTRFENARNGTILPLFAILLFAILPLMSLIVHVGLVTLTRRQMQTVVNAVALEGMRHRDDPAVTDNDPDDPQVLINDRNKNRRDVASNFSGVLLAEDLNPGVGPSLELTDGIQLSDTTNFRASRIVRAGRYEPNQIALLRNPENEVNGDMVAGNYDVEDLLHEEDDSFVRSDFQVVDDIVVGDAFLVRMRRSHDTFTGPNVGSTEPPVPFLFGRGPFGDADWMNFIEQGTIVRATAIAHTVPARTVGVTPEGREYGVAPIWIDRESWNGLDDEATFSLNNGVVEGEVDGALVNPRIVRMGDLLVMETDLDGDVVGTRFVPIYEELPSDDQEDESDQRVVGFGIAEVSINASGGTLTRLPTQVAVENASASWRPNIAPEDLAEFLQLLSDLAEVDEPIVEEPLLAPALVRTVR